MASLGLFAESSSGEEEEGFGDLGPEEEDKELPQSFEQAAQHLQNLLHVASREQLLYLYARYKQVKVGKCNTPKPGFFDFEGKQKWEAWKALGDYSPQQAMQEYIATVRKVDPAWSPKAAEGANEQRKTTFGGPVVSCLFQEQETIREEDKNIFDYCRENNIARVSQAVCSGTVDVNATDEEGRGLLHWACDRGHSQLVSVLLQHNSHVNIQNHYSFITLISVHPAQAISVRQQGGKNYFLAPNKRRQDSEGQTPLHYAYSASTSARDSGLRL
ncbi:acyl-CoA-binding domain-containing protein 6 isoform X4 [Ascaphus truei]|uniref:acyl-CoA-binding domain-containing protein 6 isoform X4 n=1 Tax=Ascaphus truei TaxID=8439 RepID=UPI003F59A20D